MMWITCGQAKSFPAKGTSTHSVHSFPPADPLPASTYSMSTTLGKKRKFRSYPHTHKTNCFNNKVFFL